MGGVTGTSTVGGDKGSRVLNNFLDKLNIFERKNKTPSEGGQNTDYRDGDSGPAQVPAETTPAQQPQQPVRVKYIDGDSGGNGWGKDTEIQGTTPSGNGGHH
jgi:hypothetical protein